MRGDQAGIYTPRFGGLGGQEKEAGTQATQQIRWQKKNWMPPNALFVPVLRIMACVFCAGCSCLGSARDVVHPLGNLDLLVTRPPGVRWAECYWMTMTNWNGN